MSRYIDADALEDEAKQYSLGYYEEDEWAVPFKEITSAPSIDIVRCKECEHNPWDFNRTDYTCIWDDDFADRPQTPNDFCSYGERREP